VTFGFVFLTVVPSCASHGRDRPLQSDREGEGTVECNHGPRNAAGRTRRQVCAKAGYLRCLSAKGCKPPHRTPVQANDGAPAPGAESTAAALRQPGSSTAFQPTGSSRSGL